MNYPSDWIGTDFGFICEPDKTQETWNDTFIGGAKCPDGYNSQLLIW